MLIITSQELASLTGRTQPAAQIRWLESQKWAYAVGADWLPKVATAYFERRLVLGDPAGKSEPPSGDEWQVNTEALRQNTNY